MMEQTAWDCMCKAWSLIHTPTRHWNCKYAQRLLDSNSTQGLELCSMAVLFFHSTLSIWSYTATMHRPSRTWHLLPSLQICEVVMSTAVNIETKGCKNNHFCPKRFCIWKHWTWEPYKQCCLSASFKSYCFWEGGCKTTPFNKTSADTYTFETLCQHSAVLLPSDGCGWSTSDQKGTSYYCPLRPA